MWIGDTVFFRSDRNGEFNIFAFDTKTKAVRQVTTHEDFPVLNASAGGGRIVYEQAGVLHLLDPASGKSERLKIGVASDLRETRARFVRGVRWIRDAALSPTGTRALFEFRGEIVTVPAEKGDVRNLTNSLGAHDRDPGVVARRPLDRLVLGRRRRVPALHRRAGRQGDAARDQGAGRRLLPRARLVAGLAEDRVFRQLAHALLGGREERRGEEDRLAADLQSGRHHQLRWSPDSKWLAYGMDNASMIATVYAYSIEQGKSSQVSDGLSDVREPQFDT